jgi:pimeloyl-ACP methyl ester carboxylesterase
MTSVTLADGRTLRCAEYGDPSGTPLLYLHGTGSSRLEGPTLDGAARARGVRVIAPDRPGFGASDPNPSATLSSWADDACSLLDALAVDRVAVAGTSGGAPHALATAARLGPRVTAAVTVNSSFYAGGDLRARLGGRNRVAVAIASRFPMVLLREVRSIPTMDDAALQRSAGPDGPLLSDPALAAQYRAMIAEGIRQGLDAARHEARLVLRPWGLDLAAIACPVTVIVGTADLGRRFGRALCSAIPGATFRTIDGGHLAGASPAGAAAIVDAVLGTHTSRRGGAS